ncbi:hypothetical protein [Streptomyces sp. NPDC058657]|uniref:hypothetical protein n=1 Tax=unclassified Streptomyces TaxID=2593676 RepID=UPI00365E0D66
MSTAPTTGLPLIDFYVLTDQVAQALGDDWDKDDTTGTDPQTVRFAHTDGRTLGIRRQFRGQGFQTFATGPTTPRYNASGYFDDTTPHLDTVMLTLQVHLFAAFYGNRLPLTLGGARIAPQPADTPAPAAEETPAPAPPAPAIETAPDKAPAKKHAPRKTAAKKPTAPRKTATARTPAAKKATPKTPTRRKTKTGPAA